MITQSKGAKEEEEEEALLSETCCHLFGNKYLRKPNEKLPHVLNYSR